VDLIPEICKGGGQDGSLPYKEGEGLMPEYEWDWETDVLQNLNRFLGMDLRYMLGIPDGTIAGERALFVLKGGNKVAEEIAGNLAARSQIFWDSAKPTGYPHAFVLDHLPPEGLPPSQIRLRATDLLGELCFRRGQRAYLQSKEVWPAEDWPVRWVLGTLFNADRRSMVYADFRHARVKLLFTEPFFVGSDSEEVRPKRVARLLEHLQGALTLKNRYSRNETYQWAKIINSGDGTQWLGLMARNGGISSEQIPYANWG
jgi:hypothetical protein